MDGDVFSSLGRFRWATPNEEMALGVYFKQPDLANYDLQKAQIATFDERADVDLQAATNPIPPSTGVATIIVLFADIKQLFIFQFFEESNKVELIIHINATQQKSPRLDK